MKWHIVKRDEEITDDSIMDRSVVRREGRYAISHEESMEEGEESYGSFDTIQQARTECHELNKVAQIIES